MTSMPFDSPEAARAFMEQQQAEFKVHQRDMTHKVGELLDALDDTQLSTLDHLLIAANKSKHVTGYLRGQIDLIREQKYKICRCGTNHDEEFAAEWSSPEKFGAVGDRITDDTEAVQDAINAAQNASEGEETLMEKYRVQAVPEDLRGNPYPTNYRCADCFSPIVSLEDRMLREPGIGGCSGCKVMSSSGVKWYGR